MGLRGPAPKPTVIREREGNRGHRPLPENEPIYEPGLPDQPEGMTEEARAIWNDLAAEMLGAGVLRRVDALPLQMLCEDEAMIARLRRSIYEEAKRYEVDAKQEYRDAVTAWQRKKRKKGPKPTLRQFLPVDGFTKLMASTEGRRLQCALSEISTRLITERREYGLTASSNSRIAAGEAAAVNNGPMAQIDKLLCEP